MDVNMFMFNPSGVKRRLSMKWILSALLCASAFAAQAQQWPSKPVRVIVNVAPGGVADVTMRVLGARLTDTLGQAFIVENRAGGDGYIGFEAVARADPDGHTLPVVPTGRVSLYVITHPKVPVNNYAEFLAHAKANPGKLNYGTPGNGTSPHIATEVFNREAGVKLNHVPYKGAGPALNDLLAGVIDLMFDPGPGIQQARTGKVKMIAIAGPKRHPDFPNVPTLEENGIKGVDGGPHFAFYAPVGTPPAVIERLNREVVKLMQEPLVLERFRALAVDLAEPMTPQQFAAYVRSESDRYAKLIPELGLKR
jgi:tripartite-type tricarboxylate transporter receptor subunit TctC